MKFNSGSRLLKNYHSIAVALLTVLLAASCAPTSQQGPDATTEHRVSSTADERKAAIGVRSKRHMKVALLSARQMLSGEGTYSADRVAIVACGGGVSALEKGGDLTEDIRKSQAMGAEISACGLTVEHLGLSPDALADGVDVVPNGFVELIRLQSEGYYTIEL
ncbi:MAG: DsrE family protein [Myxococcota bacterium]